MRLIYTESGEAIPDAQLREVAARLTRELPDEFKFSTSSLIDYMRLEVLRGNINRTEVAFVFNGADYFLDELGDLDWYNIGYTDYNFDCLANIFKEQQRIRNERDIR